MDNVKANTLFVIIVASLLAVVGMVAPESSLFQTALFAGQQYLSGNAEAYTSPPKDSHLRGFMATVFGIVGWYVGCVIVGRTSSGSFRKASAIGRFVWGITAVGLVLGAGGPAGLVLVLLVVDLASGAHLLLVETDSERERRSAKAQLEPAPRNETNLARRQREERNERRVALASNPRTTEGKGAEKPSGNAGKRPAPGHFASVYLHVLVGVPVAVLLLVRPAVATTGAARVISKVLGVVSRLMGASAGEHSGDGAVLGHGLGHGLGFAADDGLSWGVAAGGEPVRMAGNAEAEASTGTGWEVWPRLAAVQMLLFSVAMLSVKSTDFFASLLFRGMVVVGAALAVFLGASFPVMLLYAAPHTISLPASITELAFAGWGGWGGGARTKPKQS